MQARNNGEMGGCLMTFWLRLFFGISLSFPLALASGAPGVAETPEAFYKGRQLSMIVGNAAGGG